MEKIKALSLIVVLTFLFPSVTKFTPAQAVSPNLMSITEANSLAVVVNKQNPLNPKEYIPEGLTAPHFGKGLNSNPYGRKLRADAAAAAIEMAKAMKAAGRGTMIIQSAYRSYKEQKAVHDRQVKRYGLKTGEALAARPGYSEHQTGLAMDISAQGQGCQIRVCFGQTKAGYWLIAFAYKYGFILRYPNGATSTTGYQYEPWHFRYVGVELATNMHTLKSRTLEEFFGLPSAPKY